MTEQKALTVPARILNAIEELEREYPSDSFEIRLDVWTHRCCGTLPRHRTATYALWSDEHRISVTHADPAQLPRMFREALEARRQAALEPVAVEEPEAPLPTEEAAA